MLEQTSVDNRRIAKNTVMLYVRMLLSTAVSLYTSRVVLQTLGVEDYGIYGVVGGIVTMFSAINGSMAGATSRFLIYATGKDDSQELKNMFSSAMNIHILIALLVFVIAETFGLWFLCNKLVIPEERMTAAHFVYQFSIIGMFFGVTQVPYNAVIVAHEKMDVYAYVELLNVFLKLGIVYLLMIGKWDRLILYSGLSLGVSIFIAMVYRTYCLKNYSEARYHFIWDKKYLVPMLNFCGWDLYRNVGVISFTQGITMVLNMFFGPILNTANSISLTVQGVLKGFSYNVIMAFRPQIIKKYARGDMESVNNYCVKATQYCLMLFSLLAVPFFFETEYILHLWLGIVPEHTAVFLKITLVGVVFNLANHIVNIPIEAYGKMKLFSAVTGSCYILAITVLYIMLKFGIPVNLSYMIFAMTYLMSLLCTLAILKMNLPAMSIRRIVLKGYLQSFVCMLPGVALSAVVHRMLADTWGGLLMIIVLNACVSVLCTMFIIMDKNERVRAQSYVNSKLCGIFLK